MQKHNISLLLNLLSRSAHVGHCVTQPTKTRQQAAARLCRITFKPKYLGGSCERHFVYAHVRRYRRSRRWPESWHNIDDSRRKAGLSKQYERKQALVGDDCRAKQNHGRCGGIRTQPNLLTCGESRGTSKKERERRQQTDSLPKEKRPERGRQRKQRTRLRFVEMIITLLLFDGLEMWRQLQTVKTACLIYNEKDNTLMVVIKDMNWLLSLCWDVIMTVNSSEIQSISGVGSIATKI